MDTAEERTASAGERAHDEDPAARRAARFGRLPHRVEPAEMVEEHPASPPNDPRFGRDPDTDWMLRYSA